MLTAGLVALTLGSAVLPGCTDEAPSADDNVVLTSADRGAQLEPGIAINQVSEGKRLPDVTLSNAAGEAVPSASLVGTPLVLNVWFSACPPCKKELPDFATVAKEYTGKVRFIGLNIVDDDLGADFAAEHGVTYELLGDLDGNLTTALRLTTYPVTIFVDADGTIVRQVGATDAAELRSIIDGQLLTA